VPMPTESAAVHHRLATFHHYPPKLVIEQCKAAFVDSIGYRLMRKSSDCQQHDTELCANQHLGYEHSLERTFV